MIHGSIARLESGLDEHSAYLDMGVGSAPPISCQERQADSQDVHDY